MTDQCCFPQSVNFLFQILFITNKLALFFILYIILVLDTIHKLFTILRLFIVTLVPILLNNLEFNFRLFVFLKEFYVLLIMGIKCLIHIFIKFLHNIFMMSSTL
jgi:hypothetical protein